jgi:1,4-dihydroxy-6-naphthoate synthase
MELTLAYSPCPNDTFIFDALVHHKVDTEGLRFRVQLLDIQELNALAASEPGPDVVKVSFFQYAQLLQRYQLLESGAALGRGCGPLVVAREALTRKQVSEAKIGIPGWNTTAHLLLNHWCPEVHHKQVLPFHAIMPAVASGELDAGLIIHESRFTYPQYGLQQVVDLGAHWEATTGLPIPLGGIIARKSLGPEVIAQVDRALARSIEYAFTHRADVMPYVRAHAQEMADEVMEQHIALYVNEFTRQLGVDGHRAVDFLLQYTHQHSIS